MTRTLFEHMPLIKENFAEAIVRHMPHTYDTKMVQKSAVVNCIQYLAFLSFIVQCHTHVGAIRSEKLE